MTASSAAPQRILIIDDEKSVRQVLSTFLSDLADVELAVSGEEGLAFARENPPDIILLDIALPEMDGYEVCKQLKQAPETSRIPVIFITGKDSSDDEERGLELGAVDFIVKPLYPSIVRFRVTNVLRLRQINRELEHLAATDPLTGANNRRQFMQVTQNELLRSRRYEHPLTILMIDIDHFKSINDEYGHGTGDEALKMAVGIFQHALRAEDTLGRIGGEEFAAVLPETDIRNAVVLAERLREAISKEELDTPDGKLSFTVSIGASEINADDEDVQEILKRADELLYKAKESGRNCVVYG
jgi:diguanylate cyclase (GGDEF)-like protein